MMPEKMTQYVIYKHPGDHPDKFVVRRWLVHFETPPRIERESEAIVVNDLEAARDMIPEGFILLGRMEGDDPAIQEVWI